MGIMNAIPAERTGADAEKYDHGLILKDIYSCRCWNTPESEWGYISIWNSFQRCSQRYVTVGV